MQAVHQCGEGALRGYGDTAERMYPSGLFDQTGISVVVSSDVPVQVPNVFFAMGSDHVANLKRVGARCSVLDASCAVDRETALRGHTITGAWTMRREHQVGSVAPASSPTSPS